MIEIRDHVHKLRSFARAGRSQDYQDSYEPAIIASQMEMTSKTAENTLLCELEAVEKIDIFEMDGLHCSYDQDEWLGLKVWDFFIQGKFIESKPKAGLSPGLPEMNRLFYKDFDSTGAINQMIKTDPHLKWSLDQAKRASLFKALGLVVRNTSLDLPQIVATLTPFCRYGPVFASRGEHVKAAVSLGPPSSQSTSTPADYQPPSDFQGNTEQTDEEHVKAAVSLGPPSSQSTSTPPEYQPPSDFQGDTEQTDEEHVKAAVGLGPPSSQSTPTPPEYQPPSNFQGNTEQTDEEHVYTSALKELGDSEYCLPTYNLTQLCYSPPRWEAVAQYKGVRSSAEASSKKAAKHSASKALWLQLGNSTLL